MTVHDDFLDSDSEEGLVGSSVNMDSDVVLMTGSDADSSGDGKIATQSIDGEEGLVNVTMNDGATTSSSDQETKKPYVQWPGLVRWN